MSTPGGPAAPADRFGDGGRGDARDARDAGDAGDSRGSPGDSRGIPRGGWLELPAPAKINLYLRVLGRRTDGYHELVTVLQTVDLCDTLRLRLRPRSSGVAPGAPDISLTVSPAARDVPTGPDNLVVRAALALLAEAGAAGDVGLDLELHKLIPAGGGLGGGSSDAATTISGLNQLLGSPLDAMRMTALAAALGSDVPFFLYGGTALCTGRGEDVEAIEPPAPFRLVLYVPTFGTRTPEVYSALGAGPVHALARHELPALARALAGADEQQLHALFRNDLQAAAVAVQPALRVLLARPDMHLSGSGSTLFSFGSHVDETAAACRTMLICSREAPGIA